VFCKRKFTKPVDLGTINVFEFGYKFNAITLQTCTSNLRIKKKTQKQLKYKEMIRFFLNINQFYLFKDYNVFYLRINSIFQKNQLPILFLCSGRTGHITRWEKSHGAPPHIFYFKKHAMPFLLYGKTSFESHENSY
jgi:hypothetical protein